MSKVRKCKTKELIPIQKLLDLPDSLRDQDAIFAACLHDEILPLFVCSFDIDAIEEARAWVKDNSEKGFIVLNLPGRGGMMVEVNDLPENYEEYAYLVLSIKHGEVWFYKAYDEDSLAFAANDIKKLNSAMMVCLC